jgi:energy-coupling factor transporter transmembrane protein EcfT
MVGLVFFFIMIVVFFIALSFIVLNVIFIIIWMVKKRKGKIPQKRYIVIPIIFLVISLLIEVIPVGWIGMIRSGNKSASKDVIVAKSGKIVYWGYGANGDDTLNNFTMDGITYVGISYLGSSDTWELGKSVANIRPKSADETLNKIMSSLTAHDDTSTLYSVINEKGVKLYTIESTITIGHTITIYCPENQKDLVLKYYKNLSLAK